MRLIDANALINEAMERYCSDCERRKGVKNGKWKIVYSIGDVPCRACGIGDMIDELEDAPTIEERKTGRWIRTRMPLTGAIEHRCSRCDTPYYMAFAMEMNFCPNCGARMDGEHDG